MSHPRIAIIGAGPVGTTLARLLLLHAPSARVTVFESDSSPNYRKQGGTLDLHTDTGLATIGEAELWGEFLEHARYEGQSLKMTDKNLNIYHEQKPSSGPDAAGQVPTWGGQRPEIDRGDLRRILVESLPKGVVQWGHKLKALRLAPGHGKKPVDNELVFTVTPPSQDSHDGIAATGKEVVLSGFDLIVGADGGWSKVRGQALSDIKPYFSGIMLHELNVPDAKNTVPDVYAFLNHGSVFAHMDYERTALQQMSDGSIQMAVAYRVEDETWVQDRARCGFDSNDLDETKKALLQRLRTEGWHPLLSKAVAHAQGKTTPRALYMLPVGFSWGHRAGITAVGDAAHVMTPFAGEGVNVGMQDARLLAKGIQAAGPDTERLDGEVAAFEREMFARAGSFQRLTEEMMRHWFYTENSPEAVMPKVAATLDSFYGESSAD